MSLSRSLIVFGKAMFLVCFGCLSTRAQGTSAKIISAPDCSAENVDPDIKVPTSRDNSQAVEIRLLNVSGHSCYLRGELAANFMTVKKGAPITTNPVQFCYDCGPNRQTRWSEPLLLGNARAMQQTFAWTNKLVPGETPCVQINLLELFLGNKMLVLFQTQNPIFAVCSTIQVSPFSILPKDDATKLQEDGGIAKSLKLTAEKDTYYVGQRIRLRLQVEESDTGALSIEQECQLLFERVRSPEGLTRIDQVGAAWDTDCKVEAASKLSSKRTVTLDINSGHNNRWGGVGEHVIQFIDAGNERGNEWLPSAASNILHLRIVDPSTIKRAWGQSVEGLAANVTIDQDSYGLGQDVALHLAVENFAAVVPIYGASPVWNPCDVLEVEVRDSTGRQISGNHPWPCMGGGPSGAWRYPNGKLIPLEWSLGPLGMLPDRPGVYTVMATWKPFQGNDYSCEFCQVTSDDVAKSKPYVVRSNVASFSILDKHDYNRTGTRSVPDKSGNRKLGNPLVR
jgi:hypothetical protein